MDFDKFVKDNLAKKVMPDFKQIGYQLKRAQKDLDTAHANIEIDLTWSLTIAYHAMIRAGRALMYAKGYLPLARQTHKTIVEFVRMVMDNDYHDVAIRFSRLRRRRHDFIYDSQNHVTGEEAKTAILTAGKLIKAIIEIVKQENPQSFLF